MPALMEVQIVSDTTQRSPAAERMRLHRERKKNGMRCVMIELRETEIDALIRKGFLKADAGQRRLLRNIVRQSCSSPNLFNSRISRLSAERRSTVARAFLMTRLISATRFAVMGHGRDIHIARH